LISLFERSSGILVTIDQLTADPMASTFMVLRSKASCILSLKALLAVLAVKSSSNKILRSLSHSSEVW